MEIGSTYVSVYWDCRLRTVLLCSAVLQQKHRARYSKNGSLWAQLCEARLRLYDAASKSNWEKVCELVDSQLRERWAVQRYTVKLVNRSVGTSGAYDLRNNTKNIQTSKQAWRYGLHRQANEMQKWTKNPPRRTKQGLHAIGRAQLPERCELGSAGSFSNRDACLRSCLILFCCGHFLVKNTYIFCLQMFFFNRPHFFLKAFETWAGMKISKTQRHPFSFCIKKIFFHLHFLRKAMGEEVLQALETLGRWADLFFLGGVLWIQEMGKARWPYWNHLELRLLIYFWF